MLFHNRRSAPVRVARIYIRPDTPESEIPAGGSEGLDALPGSKWLLSDTNGDCLGNVVTPSTGAEVVIN